MFVVPSDINVTLEILTPQDFKAGCIIPKDVCNRGVLAIIYMCIFQSSLLFPKSSLVPRLHYPALHYSLSTARCFLRIFLQIWVYLLLALTSL